MFCKKKVGPPHCTVEDGATVAPGREVTVDPSRYGSAGSRKVRFIPAHVFEGHTKNFSFLGCLDKEIFDFFDSKKMCLKLRNLNRNKVEVVITLDRSADFMKELLQIFKLCD